MRRCSAPSIPIATSLNNLAYLIRDMGDAEAAEPLFRRAISVREKVLGPHHPDVATRWNAPRSDAFHLDHAKSGIRVFVYVQDQAMRPAGE
jgi:Tetratricopeptide repeat